MSEETVTFNLEVNVEKAFSNVRRIELIVFRVLGLWTRVCRLLGLPEDSPINQIIEKVQHLTMVIRTLHTAVILLQTASGPIGWAMAGLGIAGAVVTSAEFMTTIGE